MMRAARGIVFVCAGLLLSGCAQYLEPTAATVNGEAIQMSDVEKALDSFVGSQQFDQVTQSRDPEEVKRQYEQTVLSRLIRRAVLEKKAKQAGVDVSDDELAQRMEQVKSDFDSDEAFLKEIEQQGLTLDEVKRFVHDSLLEERLRKAVTDDVQPTEAEIQKYYEDNLDRFTEVRTAHILLQSNADALKVLNQLNAAPPGKVGSTFSELAKKFSIDTASAQKGGDLGYQNPSGLVPEYAQAVASLDEGEFTSLPVRTQFGFHVIRLIDRRVQPLDDVRDQVTSDLTTQMQDDAWNEYLQRAYNDAGVEINSRYGVLDRTTFLVVNADAGAIPGGEEPPPTPTPNPNAPQPLG
jgi:foldase protein PrsA